MCFTCFPHKSYQNNITIQWPTFYRFCASSTQRSRSSSSDHFWSRSAPSWRTCSSSPASSSSCSWPSRWAWRSSTRPTPSNTAWSAKRTRCLMLVMQCHLKGETNSCSVSSSTSLSLFRWHIAMQGGPKITERHTSGNKDIRWLVSVDGVSSPEKNDTKISHFG